MAHVAMAAHSQRVRGILLVGSGLAPRHFEQKGHTTGMPRSCPDMCIWADYSSPLIACFVRTVPHQHLVCYW